MSYSTSRAYAPISSGFSMDVTEAGMLTEVMPQPEKAPSPILLTVAGISMLLRFLQE